MSAVTTTFARQVQAAAGTRLSLADVQSVLVAAETLRAVDTVRCDECGERTADPETCPHGREQCPECRENGLGCRACAREALDDAS